MIIAIDAAGAVTLQEADNFRGFKVTSAASKDTLAKALASVGRYDGEHAWISRVWLEQQGASYGASWKSEFDKMLGYAQSKGWVEDDAIRAHIEATG
jgi:hypothetical protein